ncbi:MAG: SpoIID/LytB domain-containing protein [Acidobacteria bacterium]|nr:SpoIID/LytB domain-containing protein [Acidobacteriota bacterium]
MTPLPEDSRNLAALFLHRREKEKKTLWHPRLKARSRNRLARLILLTAFLVCGSACGRKEARVEPPHRPADPSESGKPSKSPVPSGSAEARGETIPPPDIVAETLESPAKRLDAAKGTPLGPTIRIGLTTDDREILISSDGGYYLRENLPEASRQSVRGEIRVRVEREEETTGNAPCYRIQVLSLRSRSSAEELRGELSAKHNVPVIIRENEDATSNRIRVGEFQTRAEAQKMLDMLKSSGHPDAFIVEDIRSIAQTGEPVLALRGENNLFYLNRTGFLFIPSSDTGFMTLNGKAYRGLLDIRLNGNSRITVVNQLRLEEYLLGVVPAELSPVTYPEFDALAAQSIAARTYALKNMGRYRSEGFDLTDDDRTQVYQGMAAEQDASDEAVRLTAGLSIYYEDELIDAMYMSTCGGRTEDFSNVYGTSPVPYLKSVFCAIEGTPDDLAATVTGRPGIQGPVLTDDGIIANRDLELARILGIVRPDTEFTPTFLSGTMTEDEALGLIKNTLEIIDKNRKPSSSSPDTRAGFLKCAAESIFGSDEIQRRISERDAAYYIGNLKDGDAVPESAHSALAYLMQKGLWFPFSDNTVRPNDSVRRIEAILLLLRWAESIRSDFLHHGVFAGPDSPGTGGDPVSDLQIKWEEGIRKFRLSDTLPIFRTESGRKVPVDRIRIIGNEKTRFHLNSDKKIDFLEVELNPTGAASDRYSPVATWEVTLPLSDVARKLRGLSGDIGEFRNMEPARLGKSGRAVEIRVIGSRTSGVLNGYRVRGALGLRDTLFTLTRKYNPDGSVAEFTFHGRGFGHGIGLCQTGAYGMAKAGKSYEEILKTYYTGVEIRKAY